jgi:hypothetical protein
VKELGSRFAEVEQRVRALVEENSRLRVKVRELEEERGRLGEAAREAETLHARKAQVQDRLKRLLHLLEAIPASKEDVQGSETGQAGAHE